MGRMAGPMASGLVDCGGAGQRLMMRIGILGGSFDPVHRGHLGVAGAVADGLALDRVWLMPAAQAPLRDAGVRATGEQRAAMVKVALAEFGDARMECCDRELRRGGVSYTVETLRALRAERPDDVFTWIVGADQWARLGEWREPAELARLAEWAVYARPGQGEIGLPAVAGLRWRKVEAPRTWEISSTEVRRRLAAGEDASTWVPDKVIEYIRENGLYAAH
jgi:nicotinate-nucleotide adenylyltransferase